MVDPHNRKALDISIVVPVYRSERGLDELVRRVTSAMTSMGSSWELILVDDGSPDGSAVEIERLCSADPRIRGLLLARNHGQHYATLCGLKSARGRFVVTLDDDLQNPPEEISKLVKAVEQGAQIAIGSLDSVKQNWFRRLSSWAMQALLSWLLHKPGNLRLSSFRCLSRKATDLIAEYDGIFPYMPALMFNSVPFRKIVNVEVHHDRRKSGSSSYTFRQLIKLSSFLLINQSKVLLRAVVVVGLLLAALAGVMTLYFVVRYLVLRSSPVGWTSLAVLTTFFSGMLLVSLGIIGEYIGRIIDQSDRTPRYQVYKQIN